ncbi:MAG: hypothetical protein DI598_20800, partial [Pseudopedobacter saltans]
KTLIIILIFIFFLFGQFGYSFIYKFTLWTIQNLSSVPISFFGKFQFWLGDYKFSIIVASIPLIFFFTAKILKTKQVVQILIQTLYFITSYLFVCYWTSLGFHSLNHFYHGETIVKNLKEIHINEIFLLTILFSTILTCITYLIFKLVKFVIQKIFKHANQNK